MSFLIYTSFKEKSVILTKSNKLSLNNKPHQMILSVKQLHSDLVSNLVFIFELTLIRLLQPKLSLKPSNMETNQAIADQFSRNFCFLKYYWELTCSLMGLHMKQDIYCSRSYFRQQVQLEGRYWQTGLNWLHVSDINNRTSHQALVLPHPIYFALNQLVMNKLNLYEREVPKDN